jgi:murein DD-endopeptidase MepM/ murein hydrolase activator NlpD
MPSKPKMPTLGAPPRSNPLGKVLVTSLALGAVSGGAWWVTKGRTRTESGEALSATATAGAPAAAVPSPGSPGTPAPAPGGAPAAAAVAAAPAAPSAAPAPAQVAGPRSVSVRIDGPLETALVQAAGSEVGPALAQVVTRSLVWWMDVPQDLLRNDQLDVVYELPPGEEPLVLAVRYASNKSGKTYAAYRFRPEGEQFARYYQASGDELEMRLENSPLDDYEQVTSLLRDGRRHKGVDFKAPVGTPLKAPFSGTITRRNWNFRGNGNCLELTESGGRGRKALFLHLDELPAAARVGAAVRVGQALAATGNSGRSFAPHLHYQMMLGETKVLDPFEQHKTYRRSLPAAARASFDAERTRLEGLLGVGGGTTATSSAATR